MLVVTALRERRKGGYTVQQLRKLFGVTPLTLKRWIHYFCEIFPQSRAWRVLRGRLWPPLTGGVTEMIERFMAIRDGP